MSVEGNVAADAPFSCGDRQAGETAQAFLRRVTRPWHETVEDAFAPFDLATPAGLGGFLARQAAAVLPLEWALERAGIADQVPDWAARRRSRALMEDLGTLSLAVPAGLRPFAVPSGAHALGSLYVLEGSKLGGRVLLRRAAASSDARVQAATRFLGHHAPGEWRRFVTCLEAAGRDGMADLRAGAEAAFALFAAAAAGDSAEADLRPLVQFFHA